MIDAIRRIATAAMLSGLAAACGEPLPTGPDSSPGGQQPGGEGAAGGGVSFSVAVTGRSGLAAASVPSFDLTLGDNTGNSLLLTRVAMVLREVELELQNDNGCDDSSNGSSDDSDDDRSGDDDQCEKFLAGPFLLELPLDGSVETVVTLDHVTPGVYDELEFEIHKPEDDTPSDLDFIQRHPDFRRVSIRVEGAFNSSPFVYVTDLNEDQEVALVPPLTITDESGPTNVTLTVDVDSWFRRADGSLVDPTTANEGGPNEKLVEDNIELSVEGYEDDDFDGEDD